MPALSKLFSGAVVGDLGATARFEFFFKEPLGLGAGGTFMSTTLGAATKLLDEMMANYS